MKVLWLCNTLIPEIANELDLNAPSKPESWITGVYGRLKSTDDIGLVYLFPSNNAISKNLGNLTAVGYPQKNMLKFEKEQVSFFEDVLKKHDPDVIQIFGTEFPHSYAMALAAEKTGMLSRTVAHIQGISWFYAKHSNLGVPNRVVHSYTLRDFIRRDNLYLQQKGFENRGKYEKKTFELIKNVMGRTDWDYTCAKMLNPDINYYYCGETLRPAFFERKWSYSDCEKYSVFVSQSIKPLKGFHFALEAMPDILKRFPNAHLYVTGPEPEKVSIKHKTSYQVYLQKLIKKYNLKDNVTFLGALNEQEMCERMLKSNVFLCCSTIENSSNSIGEAMLMGVPSVCSDVGGIKSLMEHNVNGVIYQTDAPYMLAGSIMKIFEDIDFANAISKNSQAVAFERYDKDINFDRLTEIYSQIQSGDL